MEKKSIFSMIVILSLFYACSEPDSRIDEGPEKLLSVAEVGFSLKSPDGTSKSFFEEGDEIGLYISGSQGTGGYNKLAYKNNAWELQTPVPLTESYTDIYATYPYLADNTDPFHFVIEHTSRTDYLYSDMHSVNNTYPVLSLAMMHALALIEFEFQHGSMSGNNLIDFISIDGWGLHSKARVDLLSGKVEYVSELREPAIMYGWQMDNPFIGYGTRISLMVVPVKEVVNDGDISVNMLIGRSKYHWLVPAGTKWESGKKYIYRVSVQERLLEITDVRIEDWRDAGKERIHLPYRD